MCKTMLKKCSILTVATFIMTLLISNVSMTNFSISKDISPINSTAASNNAITKNDVLSVVNGKLYFEGKPYAEISFNKFDLFWQLWDEAQKGHTLDSNNPKYVRQDNALKKLKQKGFKSIRIFGAPWAGLKLKETLADPVKKENVFFYAMDTALNLCDKYDIRVTYSLGAGDFMDITRANNGALVYGQEHLRELVSNKNSNSRQRLYKYIDEVVNRYKNRKTIFMWEVHNELVLNADIHAGSRIYENQRMPRMRDVAKFYDDVAKRIKFRDPLRIVNSGSNGLREFAWNLMNDNSWQRDKITQQIEIYKLLVKDTALDVNDVHYYSVYEGGQEILDHKGNPMGLDMKKLQDISKNILNKPLILGEVGALPQANPSRPDIPRGYVVDLEKSKTWFKKAVDDIISNEISLAYWWCYQSDREMDNIPDRMDVSVETNPELVQIIADANQKLKQKLTSPLKQKLIAIRNGDFNENAINGIIPGWELKWTNNPINNDSYARIANSQTSTNKFLQISNGNSNGADTYVLSEPIVVDPLDGNIVFTSEISQNLSTDDSVISAVIEQFDSRDRSLGMDEKTIYKVDNNFQKISMNANIKPNTFFVRIRFGVGGKPNQVANIDKITLKQVKPAITRVIEKQKTIRVRNSAFMEPISNSKIPGWETTWTNGTGNNDSTSTTNIGSAWQSAVVLKNGTVNGAYRFILSNAIPVSNLQNVKLTSAIKQNISQGSNVYITLIQFDSNGNNIREDAITLTSGNGNQVKIENLSAQIKPNTSSLRIRFGVGGNPNQQLSIAQVRLISY